jgi:hypothetical protein
MTVLQVRCWLRSWRNARPLNLGTYDVPIHVLLALLRRYTGDPSAA